MIDLDHPFYKPLWARLLIVGALGIYSAYKLFYEFNRRPSADAAQKPAQEERQ